MRSNATRRDALGQVGTVHDVVSVWPCVATQAAPVPVFAVATENVRVALDDVPQVVLQDPHAPHEPTQSTEHKLTVVDRSLPGLELLGAYPHTICTLEHVVPVRPDTVSAMEVDVLG